MAEELLSVGIDIGTTTTQLIFSRLTVSNVAGSFSIPRIEIINKEIIYKSSIYFTPLTPLGRINLQEIKRIISIEYEKANVNKKDISTGAIIITGESARKENSEEVLQSLSEFSGDFVVEAAGADLESLLAGFGAGASEFSKKVSGTIINFDVGGGTTNSSSFKNGNNIDAFALDIGGRLIKIDENLEIEYISNKIKPMINSLKLDLKVGIVPELYELKKLTNALAEVLCKIAANSKLEECEKKLFIQHEDKKIKAEAFMFSGGVAEFVYGGNNVTSLSHLTEYEDIGPLLGISIREIFKEKGLSIIEPKEKIRATVIGAGSYSVSISGSTIVYDEEILPMKNVPIVKLSQDERGIIQDDITSKLNMYSEKNIAIAIKGNKSPSYEEIKLIASKLSEALSLREKPAIIILENDFAKALGQVLKIYLGRTRKMLCIDGIKVESGNYVDIGKPIAGVIPVIIKTLIFNF